MSIAGCTSLVQPMDVCFNRPFKAAIEKLATQHMQDNLQAYVNGELNASNRRSTLYQVGWRSNGGS